GDDHAAEVLGPWPVQRGVEQHPPDALRAELLGERWCELARVHRALHEQPHRVGAGAAVRQPRNVRARVNAKVGEDARNLDVVWSARPSNGDALPAQVVERLDALVGNDLLAADVAPGDEDDGVTPIDPGDEG